MFAERKVQLTRSWKEEGFGSLYHALLMCEMMEPYTSKSVRLACVGGLNAIQSIKDQYTKIKIFIQTIIGGMVTYQSFSIDEHNELLITPSLFDRKPHKREKGIRRPIKQKMKTHSGAQQNLKICCAYPKTTK